MAGIIARCLTKYRSNDIPAVSGIIQPTRIVAVTFAMLLLLAGYIMPALAAGTGPKIYHLGIFPYMPPRQTIKYYGPVALDMERVLHRPVRLESQRSFTDFTQALDMHTYDIALIQPFDFPRVVDKDGYIPLARLSVPLVTHFYVRSDSKFHKLSDLKDTTIAMPPAKAANSRMALRALYKNGLIPGKNITVRYFNSHDSCIQQVWVGNASACTTAPPPIQLFEKRMKARLRSIYKTPPIPHILFVADPRVPLAQREALKHLIINWKSTRDGQKILKDLAFPSFTSVKPGEYNGMKHYEPMSAMAQAGATDSGNLVLGIFPYISSRQLVKNFAPLLPALSHAINMPVYLRTAPDFGSFSDNLASGKYDIVLVQPFEVRKAIKLGYVPLAMMKNFTYGTFYVRKKSPFHEIQDLKGHLIAMAPIESAQSHLGRTALRMAGLVPGKSVKIKYLHTHDACLRAVQLKTAAACVTSPLVLKMLPASFSTGLRRIGKTQSMPGVVFLARNRIPETIRKKLKNEILSWQHTRQGHKILKSMNFGDFVPIKMSEYRHLSELDQK